MTAYVWSKDGKCTSGLRVRSVEDVAHFLRRHGHVILVEGGDYKGHFHDARFCEAR